MNVMSSRRWSALLTALAVTAAASVFAGTQNPRALPSRDPGAKPVLTGTAIISGTVTVAGSGVPARRARVTLSGVEAAPNRNLVSDEYGRFVFAALPPGRYVLRATRPGYIAGTYGQSRPGGSGTPIQLADGEKFDARLQMTRGGVLTGTVLDEAGEAIPGTPVRALRYVMQNGHRTLQQAGAGSTDDRGIYRIYGLQPGSYVVAAMPRNTNEGPSLAALRSEMEALRERAGTLARTGEAPSGAVANRLAAVRAAIADVPESPSTGYAPVYYPGTTMLPQAGATTIAPGEERAGLDFQLQRVPVARVEGFVVNSTGQPVQNIQVALHDANHSVPGVGNNSARADSEGRFRFSNVAPGQYRLTAHAVVSGRGGRQSMNFDITADKIRELAAAPHARPQPNDQIRLWSAADISVDGRDLTNVALSLQLGVSLSGRVVFQGASLPPPSDPTRLRVSVVPADIGPGREHGGPVNARADASGKFALVGIVPGIYRINAAGAPPGWVLESAAVDGQDALDFPFEVKPGQNLGTAVLTFTDQRAELTGALTDGQGRPAPGYTLILFPADQRYWVPQSRRIRTTRPATDGHFILATVPAGEYRLVPVVDIEPGAWFDPAVLQELDAAALRVSIAEGEKKVQNVRLAVQ